MVCLRTDVCAFSACGFHVAFARVVLQLHALCCAWLFTRVVVNCMIFAVRVWLARVVWQLYALCCVLFLAFYVFQERGI